jgi:ADP-heptose:LPS heptosyltransferase
MNVVKAIKFRWNKYILGFIEKYILSFLYVDIYLNYKYRRKQKHILPSGADNILIANLDTYGDSIFITPLIVEVRKKYPKANIHLLINKNVIPLFEANHFVDKVYPVSANEFYDFWGLFKLHLLKNSIKDTKFDIGFIVSMGARPADSLRLLANEIGIKYIYSTNAGILKNICNWTIPINQGAKYWPRSFCDFSNSDHLSDYEFLPQINYEIDKDILSRLGILKPFIILNTQVANYGLATKKWPDNSFIELAKMIGDKYTIVLTGSQDEFVACEKNYTALIESGLHSMNLSGKVSLKELYSLISFSKAVVTSDTFLFHLSVAAKKNVFVIFGATDYKKIAPKVDFVHKYSTTKDCYPCHKQSDNPPFWPECIYEEALSTGAPCLKEITPQQVYNDLRSVL